MRRGLRCTAAAAAAALPRHGAVNVSNYNSALPCYATALLPFDGVSCRIAGSQERLVRRKACPQEMPIVNLSVTFLLYETTLCQYQDEGELRKCHLAPHSCVTPSPGAGSSLGAAQICSRCRRSCCCGPQAASERAAAAAAAEAHSLRQHSRGNHRQQSRWCGKSGLQILGVVAGCGESCTALQTLSLRRRCSA